MNAILTHSFFIYQLLKGGTAMKYINRYRAVALNLVLAMVFYLVATGFGACYASKPY